MFQRNFTLNIPMMSQVFEEDTIDVIISLLQIIKNKHKA